MYSHTHLLDTIYDAKEAEICSKNLHVLATIYDNQTKETIRVPYASILSNYRDFLEPAVVRTKLSEGELMRYRYSPKWLSEHLYGTTELWSVLLDLNGMLSTLDFNRDKIKIYNQHTFNLYLNEILIMEGKIVE